MAKNKKTAILAAVVLIGAAFVLFYLFSGSSLEEGQMIGPSRDQAELVKAFGYPNTFLLSMDQGVRYENWTYYDMGRIFVFLDGAFLEENSVDSLEGQSVSFPDFRPTQFIEGMSLDEVSVFLGQPSAGGDIDPDILEEASIYNYRDQITVGTSGQRVVFVQTFPVIINE